MRLLLSILVTLYISTSCNLKTKERKPIKEDSHFVLQERAWINKLSAWDVVRYNDSAKWRLYCYYGDDTCKQGIGISKLIPIPTRQLNPIPLAFLDLKLAYADYQKGRLSLLYSFVYDDSTEVLYTLNRSKKTAEDYRHVFGVEFDVKADSVIGYSHGHGTFSESGTMVRYETFTHSDLVRFVNKNANSLHPWFRKEAIRRGLLSL